MTTNLVLQGPQADHATLERLARLAGPAQGLTALGGHALRVDGVTFDPVLKAELDAAAFAAGVDATFIAAGRTLADFRLVAMDMDSTLITIECIDEIADMQGLKPQVAAITEAAMRGELDFSESLTRRVALLEGLDASALQRVYDERLRISMGGEAMLRAVQAAGLKTLLVSGGFTFFTDRLKPRLGLDHTHANTLEVVDGKLTGRVLGGIVDAEEKKRTVERVCAELGIAPAQAIVMGDGANDLKMMSVSGLSVAFRAKPVVREQADVALNFSGLDGLLNILS
ncbi:phosphoserine phosphatase SerB [Massilia sp. YIM B02443]|uniref:phosphoserine phosphatase SerB n=1 Tax=Massilia sp. YIM B02443 TaxID=3050127 RepID=UPI0025B6D188|nr:phosphoserine phosphatase SerB [Massilia sp. YIM B02443]MDN4039118.1 phosphoserine phosphatase SerB [Massilia sp. YIM B02443]